MRIHLLSLPLLLVACGDKSDDTGAEAAVSEYETDDDGDGVSEADGDCDDADATVNPSADELCDGVDNDCDGTIDDGAGDLVTFYWDYDGDGAGDASNPVEACALPAGAAETDGDCDDLDAEMHPGATEVCDGIDNDCDAAIDDDDDSLDLSTHADWYRDADGDGYGDPDELVGRACEALPGTVADATDCDDGEVAVNPGAVEVCDVGGADEDCDGLVNDADDSIYVASQTLWYPDTDGDGFGDSDDAGTPLCEDPTTEEAAYVDVHGDCADADATTYPGAEEVCTDGVVNDCDGTEADATTYCAWNSDFDYTTADTIIGPEDGDNFSWFGESGDLDGDGTDDLVIGSPWSSEGEDGYGRVYVLHGPLTAAGMNAGDDVAIDGYWDADSSDTFGVDPSVYDVDGDGYDDLWVGSPGVDIDGDSNVGAAFLIHGPVTSGASGDLASLVAFGTGDNDAFGTATAIIGDQDGDGVADLVVSDSYAGTYKGEIYVISGATTTDTYPEEQLAIAEVAGVENYSWLGRTGTLASMADVNGDGQGDLVIGATNHEVNDDSEGGVFVFHGPVSGYMDLDDSDLVLYDSTAETDYLGQHVHGGFDWDGDGTDDLAIGAPHSDHTYDGGGALYVAAGPITADTDLATDALLRVEGIEDDYLGGEIDHGDLDGDGSVDLLVGAGQKSQTGNGASYNGGINAAFVFLGPLSGSATTADGARISGSDDPDEEGFGGATVVLGDQDGDGADTVGIADRGAYTDSWFLFDVPGF